MMSAALQSFLGYGDVLHLVFSKLARRDKLLRRSYHLLSATLTCTKFSDPLQWISYGVTCAFIFNSLPERSAAKSPKKSFGKVWCIYQSCPVSWRWELHCEPHILSYHISHFWPSLLPNLRRLDPRLQDDTLVPFLAWRGMVLRLSLRSRCWDKTLNSSYVLFKSKGNRR